MIGTLGTLGGEGSKPNIEIIRGVELAIREYNREAQSAYEVRLQREDTKGTVDGITQAAANLASAELLIGVVGPFTFDEAELAGPLFDQTRTPFLIPNLTNAELSGHGWTAFRRLVADDRREGEAVAAELLRKTKKVVLVHDGSSPAATFLEGAKVVLESAEAAPRIVELPSKLGKNDWSSAVASTMEAGPEVVAFAGPPDKAGMLVAHLRSAGFKGQYYASHLTREGPFAEAAGDAARETISTCVCADPSNPRLLEFSSAFRREFGASPAAFAAEAYEGTLMLLEAVEEVEPKRHSLVEFLRSSPVFRGDTKRYEFDLSGELVHPTVWLYEWGQGKWQSRGGTRPRTTATSD